MDLEAARDPVKNLVEEASGYGAESQAYIALFALGYRREVLSQRAVAYILNGSNSSAPGWQNFVEKNILNTHSAH